MTDLNILQFTEESDLPLVPQPKSIPIQVPDNTSPSGGRDEYFNVWYKQINISGYTVVKLGYCCEPAAQYFPISINNTGDGSSSSINMYVGKTGMLEYQDEENLSKLITGPIYLPICFSKDNVKPDWKFNQTLDFVIKA